MPDELLEQFFKGETRALARLISLVENRAPECLRILQTLFPHTGKATVVGVTGSPGVGKSSLVDRLTAKYRARGCVLGVVAVDPSSPFSGGAILGDRIRMQAREVDAGVFIRSMATRGRLGGLAAATADVVTVLDAAGKDPVIVETVGVGQDEIDIVKVADVSIVVLVPGMGDDIQALKAGIMEIGDIFVINKCDQPGVEKVERAVIAMLSLAHRADDWTPPIVKTIATEDEGVSELVESIGRCTEFFERSSVRGEKKRLAARQRLLALLEERLVDQALHDVFPDGGLNQLVEEIAERKKDPYSIVDQIIRSSRFERLTS